MHFCYGVSGVRAGTVGWGVDDHFHTGQMRCERYEGESPQIRFCVASDVFHPSVCQLLAY